MAKTIILHSQDGPVAKHLRQCGYQVLDSYQAQRQGVQAAAVLLTGYRPDTSLFSTSDCADQSIGCDQQSANQPLTINITGHTPQQVQSVLESRLRHQEW